MNRLADYYQQRMLYWQKRARDCEEVNNRIAKKFRELAKSKERANGGRSRP